MLLFVYFCVDSSHMMVTIFYYSVLGLKNKCGEITMLQYDL